jgi:hypothetical protein
LYTISSFTSFNRYLNLQGLLRTILTLFITVLSLLQSQAQETMYIPEGALIHFGTNAKAGIFGFLRNNGNISMQQNSDIYFMGKIWMNENKATVTDAGTVKNSIKGGTVHFYGNNSMYGNVGQQILHPGYIDSTTLGVCFTNITLDNASGLNHYFRHGSYK